MDSPDTKDSTPRKGGGHNQPISRAYSLTTARSFVAERWQDARSRFLTVPGLPQDSVPFENETESRRSFPVFLVMVIAPTILAFFYLYLIASKEYVTETRFVVRTAVEQKDVLSDTMSSLSKLGLGGGGSSRGTHQDGAIVLDYIKSRPVIDDIGRSLLVDIYSKGNFFSSISSQPSLEDAWRYWNSKVSATIDTPSGIVSVKIRAFTPEDALRLSTIVLSRSETLLNEISDRSRADAMRFASNEIETAQTKLQEARRNLLQFRNNNRQIDPSSDATSAGEMMATLLLQRIDIVTRFAIGKSSLSADSLTQRLLTTQLSAIDEQISTLQAKVAGQSDVAISTQLAKYDDLQLLVKFAERLLVSAQNAFEKARARAEQHSLYLVPIVKPLLPEFAAYPRMAFHSFLVFLALFLIWAVGFFLVAAVRDHIE